MSTDQFASFERANGQLAVKTSAGQWWRQVKPFFFRPLLPFQKMDLGKARPPLRSLAGGYQHVTSESGSANSSMNFLMAPNAKEYSLDKLSSGRRWEVRSAAKRFVIRPIVELAEFKDKAHPIYISFQKRTRYEYLANRVKKSHFDKWAANLYSKPAMMILGAFAGEELGAVSVSYVIGDTFMYATFFADDQAIRQNVASLMLHTVRMKAAESCDIDEVFVGTCKQGEAKSVDDFYLLRGCAAVSRPALLKINLAARVALRTFLPNMLRHLQGVNSDAGSAQFIGSINGADIGNPTTV